MATVEELRARVDALLSRQSDHPVWPRLYVELDAIENVERLTVEAGGKVVVMSPSDLLRHFEGRERAIKMEADDPYNHGYEPAFWNALDWFIAELRATYPKEVVEVCIFGGNRAGKTDYAAKRVCEAVGENKNWLVWCFHTEQKSSRAIQQSRIWTYFPTQHKPAEGKVRKTIRQRINYNPETGFTENGFTVPNESQCIFKFYSGNADALEGDQPHFVWSDERIPIDWIEAIAVRLLTRAGQLGGLIGELEEALERHRAGELERMPRALRCRMWQGVHLVTFTPLDGLTPAVGRFTKGARTMLAGEARQLPVLGDGGKVTGYEQMPRLVVQDGSPTAAAYFWNEDNRHGGNHEGMVKLAAKKNWTRADRQIKFYGYTEKTSEALFARFSTDVHVVPASALPRGGTWYHVVDPCNGRNWFMGWFLAAPDGKHYAAAEWPPVEGYIPGEGVLGPWVTDSLGKKKDGTPGPAQKPLGWGCERYAEEIRRVEGLLWRMQHPEVGDPEYSGEAIEPAARIMDSRYGNAPNASSTGTRTIMEIMLEHDMGFVPSGQTFAADGEVKSRVTEGYGVINDLLDYDEELAAVDEFGVKRPDPAQAPRLYVVEDCLNFRWVLENFTGLDGQHGAGKDPADVVRYYAIAGPEHFPEDEWGGLGGGSY